MIAKPWVQLAAGVLCMAMIANLQYGWTLFVDPIDAKYHWGRSAIQVAFTIFVFFETWMVPFKAWIVDRYNPRIVVSFGGVLVAAAWVINSYADSLPTLYAGAVVGGFGAAAVYGTCVGNALKWFPTRRGLAAGFTAAGFGAGAALTVVPIASMIKTSGYESAFLTFGLGQGIVILIVGSFLRKPSAQQTAKVVPASVTASDHRPAQVLKTPVFWVMYATFVLFAAGGLTATAQIAPIAKDLKIDNIPVDLFGVQLAALTFAVSLDRIFDGIGRPFFGFVSDRIGREVTMTIAFTIAAATLVLLAVSGSNPTVFVLATAVFFFVFGEIYSLFPATCGDTFGSTFATTNAGMLYTAKGTAALLVPLASVLAAAQGWRIIFTISVIFSLTAAYLAFFVMRPMRAKYMAEHARRSAHGGAADSTIGPLQQPVASSV